MLLVYSVCFRDKCDVYSTMSIKTLVLLVSYSVYISFRFVLTISIHEQENCIKEIWKHFYVDNVKGLFERH